MHYAIVEAKEGSRGKPYQFFKFRSLKAAHNCPVVDEFALVYESLEQLEQLCHADDLRGILRALGVEIPNNANHAMLAKALHRLAEESATSWSESEETTQKEEEPEMATAKKTKKPAAKKAKAAKSPKPKVAKPPKERKVAKKRPLQAKITGKLDKSAKIKVLAANPARPGTIRHDNLQVIYAAKTLEEALRNLNNMPKKGGMVDVRFALANGLIEVVQNDR